jgi:CMP-N-acetylneuraminic acid synthetase
MKFPKNSCNLAVIPARGGSKGIKDKNLRKIGGKTLIEITYDAVKKSNIFDLIVISSDSEKILKCGMKIGAKTIKRPKSISLDTSPSEQAILHSLKKLNSSYKIKNIGLFQPTSPLRSAKDIKNAYKIFLSQNCKTLISTVEIDSKYLKTLFLNNGSLKAIKPHFPFLPRQKLPEAFLPNGAIYLSTENHFRKNQSFYSNKLGIYVMPRAASLDIDQYSDLEIAREIFSAHT